MENIFVILGYGIPKNILKDEQYKKYLGLVFNYIYQICLEKQDKKPVIIFCGGKTDVFKPYKRTEAGEMKKLFLSLAKRSFVRKFTSGWQYKLETNSLSTVENILGAKKIIGKIKGKKVIYIFGEKTRQEKIKILAQKILKSFKLIVFDFDLSVNRYRPEFIKRKEKTILNVELKSLKNRKIARELRKILEQRMEFYQKQGPKKHADDIYNWWQEKLNELDKL